MAKTAPKIINVNITINPGGLIDPDPVPDIDANTDDTVVWRFANQSGVTVTARVLGFRHKATNKLEKNAIDPPGEVRLGNGQPGQVSGKVKYKYKELFKYSIQIDIPGPQTINYDPDLEVAPPTVIKLASTKVRRQPKKLAKSVKQSKSGKKPKSARKK